MDTNGTAGYPLPLVHRSLAISPFPRSSDMTNQTPLNEGFRWKNGCAIYGRMGMGETTERPNIDGWATLVRQYLGDRCGFRI
jgi:hypothetical protein